MNEDEGGTTAAQDVTTTEGSAGTTGQEPQPKPAQEPTPEERIRALEATVASRDATIVDLTEKLEAATRALQEGVAGAVAKNVVTLISKADAAVKEKGRKARGKGGKAKPKAKAKPKPAKGKARKAR